jgi:hypothetical protein
MPDQRDNKRKHLSLQDLQALNDLLHHDHQLQNKQYLPKIAQFMARLYSDSLIH